jgi:hypothetical protein
MKARRSSTIQTAIPPPDRGPALRRCTASVPRTSSSPRAAVGFATMNERATHSEDVFLDSQTMGSSRSPRHLSSENGPRREPRPTIPAPSLLETLFKKIKQLEFDHAETRNVLAAAQVLNEIPGVNIISFFHHSSRLYGVYCGRFESMILSARD